MKGVKALSKKDRRVLMVAAPLIGVLVILLIFRGEEPVIAHEPLEINRLLEDVVWFQQQGGPLSALDQGCKTPIDDMAALDHILMNAGFEENLTRSGDRDRVKVVISAGNGNQVLELIDQLFCKGVIVDHAELNTLIIEQENSPLDKSSGQVSAQLELTLPFIQSS